MSIERLEVDAKLTRVTVYKSAAQLFHSTLIKLVPTQPDQEYVLVFSKGQWNRADRNSIQVSTGRGGNDVILRGVQFKTIHTVHDNRPEKRALQESIEQQEKVIQVLADRLEVGRKGIAAYEAVLRKLQSVENDHVTERRGKEGTSTPLESFVLQPAKHLPLFKFALDGIEKYSNQNRSWTVALDKEKETLQELRRKLSAIGGDEKRTSQDVAELMLVVRRPTELALQLSYLVSGASWEAVYDLRVDSKEKTMGVTYSAMVKQSVGDDWEKVELTLSTADPHVGGDAPTLTRWSISLTPPYNPVVPLAAPRMEMMMQQMMCTNMMPSPPPGLGAGGGSRAPSRPAPTATAAVSTSTTSTTFQIVGRHTVRSDNTPVKVPIMQAQLDVHLRYSAVPKLDSHTYLKAKATNSTGFVFLPGVVNTFADNQLVGKSSMDHVGNNEEFWTFLGVDDNLSCSRTLVHRKLGEKGGMFSSKRTKVEFKYVFTCKNGKKTTEELVVWDQYPIAQDKNINVTVVQPAVGDPATRFETNSLNAIEWFWNLAPNSSKTFEYVFTVEYPQEETINGL